MTGCDGVVLRRVSAGQALAVQEDLLALYGAAFAGPPWQETPASVAAHRPVLVERLDHPGVEVLLAVDGPLLVGAAYGWPAPPRLPDRELYRRLTAAVGKNVVAEHLTGGVLELVELMVHPQHQRRGIGRRLLSTIRAGRRSWLLTHPAGVAVPLYDSDGWRVAGRVVTADGHPLLLYLHNGDHADPPQ